MYFAYGTYVHEPNSVNISSLTWRNQFSERGYGTTAQLQLNITGDLYASGSTAAARQLDLTTKINALEAAYSVNGQDFGFFQDNGTISSHVSYSNAASNLTGNLVNYISYNNAGSPESTRVEYASKRSFSIGLSATYLWAERNIISYHDSILKSGLGGPIYEWATLQNGYPVPSLKSMYSKQEITHSGRAVGMYGYPAFPTPLASGPNFLGHASSTVTHHPVRYPGFKFTHYAISWTYKYVFDRDTFLLPALG